MLGNTINSSIVITSSVRAQHVGGWDFINFVFIYLVVCLAI